MVQVEHLHRSLAKHHHKNDTSVSSEHAGAFLSDYWRGRRHLQQEGTGETAFVPLSACHFTDWTGEIPLELHPRCLPLSLTRGQAISGYRAVGVMQRATLFPRGTNTRELPVAHILASSLRHLLPNMPVGQVSMENRQKMLCIWAALWSFRKFSVK
jgi:hypothetical protein